MARNFKVLPIQRTAIKPQVGERYTPKGYTQKMSSEGKIFGIVTVEKLPQPKVKPHTCNILPSNYLNSYDKTRVLSTTKYVHHHNPYNKNQYQIHV